MFYSILKFCRRWFSFKYWFWLLWRLFFTLPKFKNFLLLLLNYLFKFILLLLKLIISMRLHFLKFSN